MALAINPRSGSSAVVSAIGQLSAKSQRGRTHLDRSNSVTAHAVLGAADYE